MIASWMRPPHGLGSLVACAALAACATSAATATAPDDDVQRGRRVVARSCAGCHTTSPGSASIYRVAPPLWTLRADHTPESLQRAAAQNPGHRYAMPSIVLTPRESRDVLAYVRALTNADPETRRKLSVAPCIATKC